MQSESYITEFATEGILFRFMIGMIEKMYEYSYITVKSQKSEEKLNNSSKRQCQYHWTNKILPTRSIAESISAHPGSALATTAKNNTSSTSFKLATSTIVLARLEKTNSKTSARVLPRRR
ncbi:hypothetical protein PoB_001116800 [Plakobranchus ocellatus]|uniref:Uncharacterized protein n=1 Tax=Plakobranchus ocellatus TaxID=259542 RepID=A0AAV3YQ39_9GAST|nr:hypothetical protein PoB_001116800 [Plakobranchus ocellatus]